MSKPRPDETADHQSTAAPGDGGSSKAPLSREEYDRELTATGTLTWRNDSPPGGAKSRSALARFMKSWCS